MSVAIKVSAQSRTSAVAGAIAGMMRERGCAEIQAIGASAVNQAIKAVTIARSYVAEDGFDLAVVPGFKQVEVEGEERTVLHLKVFKLPLAHDAPNRAAPSVQDA
ncbi:stage V sporulation protein S [Caldilinea sp.]|uniref:stage V sporulation protein S n=1 Tax=Caldilinea sp. TaxID=2293560 RepID=UPI0021DD490E|nr:stage V sporulation protein S [Caldilinea sp.]GIV69269.1 MAG: stage V sporulation protein S [Caldilinea sp.]